MSEIPQPATVSPLAPSPVVPDSGAIRLLFKQGQSRDEIAALLRVSLDQVDAGIREGL